MYWNVGLFIIIPALILSALGLVLSIRRRRKSGIVWGSVGFVLSAAAFTLTYMLGHGSLTLSGLIIYTIFGLGPAIVAFVLGLIKPATTHTPAEYGAGRQNILALVAIIVVWFSTLVGLILGHIALAQIKRTGDTGRGMALTAVIVGWIATGIAVAVLIMLANGFDQQTRV